MQVAKGPPLLKATEEQFVCAVVVVGNEKIAEISKTDRIT
jgi:hypothetical protein